MCDSKLCSIFFLFILITTFASSSTSFSTSNNIHKCPKEQSEALLLFKHNLSSISYYTYYECQDWLGSDYHPVMMNWNTSTDCCNWNGVTCDYSTGDVIGLDLSCGLLSGTIHPNTSLFNLPHLQTLNLAYNYFYPSQIPREIRRFSNSLTHLNLSTCDFFGQVPPDITLLHNLVSLDLSSYGYELKLKPDVFVNLIHNLTNLEILSLYNVEISSVLPTSLNISSLKLLDLHYTGLQGILPRYIFNLHSLETLHLSRNYFTGDIPLEIPVNLTHLNFLSLSHNSLNGTLPSWLFTSPSLESLYLENNMFSGKVPSESFALPSLKDLDLGYNQLAGHTDMQRFVQLTNLTYLRLSFNNFSGEWELDTLLSSLTNLESLDLSYSGFSVTTKNANHYVNPGFRYLDLASCKLKVFPNSFRAMKQLVELDLSRNEIHGQIPHWAGEIGGNELVSLNLSHNFITGLPQFQWYGLQRRLSLQSNLIHGPFPPSICNMSKLQYLDMSNNRFGGLIPQCFGNITYFYMIDLGNNSFQGTIPNVYGACGSLGGLILNGNQLEGVVPSSLAKCRNLVVLDLGKNHLNDTFPSWLGDLPYLRALVLTSNNFHGHIQPSSTVESLFPCLLVLDLSHNGFVGQLPEKYFKSFSSMKNVVHNSTQPHYMSTGFGGKIYSLVVTVKGVNQDFPKILVDYTIIDLSNNKFEGQIPNVISGLNSLVALNLSHNSLIGPIPHALGNLTEIESLDLSWNELSGEIPESVAGIKTLEVLSLSHNRLVGRIPDGTQFNTFDENSFEGNVGLCGFPLPKKCSEYTHKPQLEAREDQEEESGFTWEVVTLGYGCGTLVGLVMGYLMLSTRKVKWFNVIADAGEHMILARNKRRYVFIGK